MRPYADVLQDELTRREAGLATAHADNVRLQTAVRQQLASKRTLNTELQVRRCIIVFGCITALHSGFAVCC